MPPTPSTPQPAKVFNITSPVYRVQADQGGTTRYTDNVTGFNTAIRDAQASANPAAVVYIPPGEYWFDTSSTAIVIDPANGGPVTILGEASEGSSILHLYTPGGPTQPMTRLIHAMVDGCVFKNFQIKWEPIAADGNEARGGASLFLDAVKDIVIDNMRFGLGYYGIYCFNVTDVFISNCDLSSNASTHGDPGQHTYAALAIDGKGSGSSGVHVTDCSINGPYNISVSPDMPNPNFGIWIGSAHSCYFNRCAVESWLINYGFTTDGVYPNSANDPFPTLGMHVRAKLYYVGSDPTKYQSSGTCYEHHLTMCTGDGTTTGFYDVYFRNGSSSDVIRNINIYGSSFVGTKQAGIFFSNDALAGTSGKGVSGINITDTRCAGNREAGVWFPVGSSPGKGSQNVGTVTISGGAMAGNGHNQFLGAGIRVDGAVDQVLITAVACNAFDPNYEGGSDYQQWGISLLANCTKVKILNCDCAQEMLGGFLMGGIAIGGTSTTAPDSSCFIANCTGYNDLSQSIDTSSLVSGGNFNPRVYDPSSTSRYYGPFIFTVKGGTAVTIGVGAENAGTPPVSGLTSGSFYVGDQGVIRLTYSSAPSVAAVGA